MARYRFFFFDGHIARSLFLALVALLYLPHEVDYLRVAAGVHESIIIEVQERYVVVPPPQRLAQGRYCVSGHTVEWNYAHYAREATVGEVLAFANAAYALAAEVVVHITLTVLDDLFRPDFLVAL